MENNKENGLTKETVIAGLMPELSKLNWQQLLNVAKDIVVKPDTISVNYNDLGKLRDLYLFLEAKRKEEDKPEKERIAARKEGYDEIMKPIEKILEKAEPDLIRINTDIMMKEAEILNEIDHQNEIRTRHIEFVNEISKLISGTSDNSELARIQMLIGSEKSRDTFYGLDYKPLINDVCDSLLVALSDIKKIIKDNVKLEKEKQKWIDAGDIPKATQIKEQIEYNEAVIRDNLNVIIENAYKKVSDVSMITNDMVSASIKPRLHRWSWKIDDIELLYKKMPHLVEKQPNKKEIGLFLKQKMEEGNLEDLKDNNFSGLILYNKQFYVSVKSTSDAS